MAAFDTTRPVAVSPASFLVTLFSKIFGAVATWNDARITRKSLSALSARELADIGLTRGDIDDVATGIFR